MIQTNRSYNAIVHQVISIMLQNRPFDAQLASSTTSNPWTTDSVSDILRSVPKFFFQSPRSIGRQKGFRHRAPLKQRYLKQENFKNSHNVLVLGPAAYRDTKRVVLGLDKAMDFYFWVENFFGFAHDVKTCREMAFVLAKGNNLKGLWHFLKEMSRRENRGLVTTSTVTCLIKVLGEEGLVKEALACFYRMKQFHCKPDVFAYNTIIHALCRVGNFNKARFLLEQMELPGFRCPPDLYTYTILISSYCKFSMQTGCRKAIRRRLYEANHLFREMLFKGFVPDVVTYNCLIDGCCKTNRIERALELFEDMNKRNCVPNRITYNSFIRYYCAVNEIDKGIEMMRRMQQMNHGVAANSSYTPIIHALCEAGKVLEAKDFLFELIGGGSIPREYTYKLVCDALNSVGAANLIDNELHKRIRDGIESRCKQVMKVKQVKSRITKMRIVEEV
ncbi:pentatricopeptide repeat-containing protein At1g77405 [Durio zibethinus]|uniref:Pentatricopeptide repeat-containing protein At1g77405 n=1 Tax=Durio zibethinus TaxID=66656 RepID=A0A6P6ATB1_DURZI|nr:pentatricopeptide repeat-containing protein At1g77405 [Durio zibethinus]